MTGLLAAELLKLRSTRTFWVFAAITLALVLLTTIADLANGGAPANADDFDRFVAVAGVAALAMLILGVVGSAGEYRHGTITSTFLVAPDRVRVLVAKSLAHALAGIALAIMCLILMLAITLPWLNGDGESLGSIGVGFSDISGSCAEQFAYVALTAMLGVALGALLTNQVAALVVVPAILIVVDPLLTLLVEAYGKFSLSGIWASVGGESSDDAGFDIFDPLAGGLIYLGYVAALTLATALLDRRRDVA